MRKYFIGRQNKHGIFRIAIFCVNKQYEACAVKETSERKSKKAFLIVRFSVNENVCDISY